MRMRAAARRAGSRRASGWAVADVEAPQRSLPRETGGFTAVRQEEVSELGGIATLYRHDRTGAELLAVLNSDPNKVFSITLRTAPEDSTGPTSPCPLTSNAVPLSTCMPTLLCLQALRTS